MGKKVYVVMRHGTAARVLGVFSSLTKLRSWCAENVSEIRRDPVYEVALNETLEWTRHPWSYGADQAQLNEASSE